MIIGKDHLLHINGLGQTQSLTGKGTLGLYIIVNGNPQRIEAGCVTDIFQIEHKVLTPADAAVHTKMILLYDLSAKELVPQHTIIEVRRILHHMRSIIFSCHDCIIINISLVGYSLPYYSVEIGNDHITMMVFCCPEEKIRSICCNPVITVKELDIFSFCQIQCHVSAVRYSRIVLMNDSDTLILCCVGITDLTRVILTAVIDQQ